MPSHLDTRENAYRDAMTGGRIKLILLLLVCAAPVIASYVTFYFLKPEGRVNYGTLIEPARLLPDVTLATLDGRPYKLSGLRGKWVLLTLDGGACAAACPDKLFKMRQLRTMQGKERERIERAWLITDDEKLSTMLIREHDDMKFLRGADAALMREFPNDGAPSDHIYLVDPLGHLILRYPRDANPARISRDIGRLLKYSRIG